MGAVAPSPVDRTGRELRAVDVKGVRSALNVRSVEQIGPAPDVEGAIAPTTSEPQGSGSAVPTLWALRPGHRQQTLPLSARLSRRTAPQRAPQRVPTQTPAPRNGRLNEPNNLLRNYI